MSQKKEGGIPAEKKRNIAIATTVAGVLLIVFLLIVLIIQFVQLGVKNSEKRELDRLIEAQQETLAGEEADLDNLENGFGMFWKALDYNYKYKD